MTRGIPGVRRRWFAILTRCRIIHLSSREKALGIPKLLFDSDDFKLLKALDVETTKSGAALIKVLSALTLRLTYVEPSSHYRQTMGTWTFVETR